MDINNFYKIKKIKYYYSTAGHVCINNIFYAEDCVEIIFDKSLPSIQPLYRTIITKYNKFVDYYWKFTDNSYIFSANISSTYLITYTPITDNKSLKEGDYVYIDTPISYRRASKEEWWNFLGNLKNPDLELIELCTTIINND